MDPIPNVDCRVRRVDRLPGSFAIAAAIALGVVATASLRVEITLAADYWFDAPAFVYRMDRSPIAIDLADFDRDGRLDVITLNSPTSISPPDYDLSVVLLGCTDGWILEASGDPRAC